MTYPVLSKAPIAAAILQILVDLPARNDAAKFDPLGPQILDGYPHQGKRSRFQFGFKGDLVNGGMAPMESTSTVDGLTGTSADKRRTIHFFLDGMTFQQNGTYKTWGDFSGEALRLWTLYKNLVKPKAIRRLGLRYQNSIDATLPLDVNDYLVAAAPQPVPDLSIGNFMTQVLVAKDPIKGPFANITQTIQLGAENSAASSILLDIDAFMPVATEVESVSSDLEQLRILKNEIFFRSISPKLLEKLT